MKSIFALILSALLAIVPVTGETAVEEAVLEYYMIEGVVSETGEEGVLVSTKDMGDVLVLSTDETIREGYETLAEGDYVYVDYNGMMTRSLPPQITALVIRSYRLDGIVTEVFAEENAVLINTETHGEVYVHQPAAEENTDDTEVQEDSAIVETAIPQEGDMITAYFNGAMTMSLPGQINAGLIVIHPVEAE